MIPLHPFHISNVGQQTFLGLWHHQPRNGQASVKRSSLWKPVTLRLPLLMSMIILTLSFIAILEYLSRKSQIDGGVVLAREGFSSATAFLYLNLPTIIAIFYSLLWSWIDLDTKRLEPWFQLSKPGGANEGDSLSLHYPFDFVAVAPLSALRKK